MVTATAITVERFDISAVPDHARPRLAAFTGKEGQINVHCSREDGSLWLFVQGPAGGDRGKLAFGTNRAGYVLAWLDARDNRVLSGGSGWMSEENALIRVGRSGLTRTWRMTFDDAALDEFRTCLRQWAEAVRRRMPEPEPESDG